MMLPEDGPPLSVSPSSPNSSSVPESMYPWSSSSGLLEVDWEEGECVFGLAKREG